MKTGIIKCLILVLALALLLCGCGKGEFTTTYSMDGIVVTVHTDKDAYTGAETAKMNMEIINNTGKEIAVSADVKTPDGLAVDLETLGGNFKAEPGKVVTLYDIGIKLNPLGLILWIVGGVVVLAAAAVAVIIILRKNKGKQAMAMLLCLVMLGGMLAYIQPLQAEASFTDADKEETPDYTGKMTIHHPVMVDGTQVYIEAVLDYEIGLPVEPEYAPLVEHTDYVDPDSKKPNGKVLAWYYNDYDGDHAMVDKGTTVLLSDNLVELGGTQEQGYMRAEILNAATSSYQADFRDNELVDNFVVHFKVSTENMVPHGTYMLYRYKSSGNTALFYIKDGYFTIGDQKFNRVTPGSWLEVDMVFNMTGSANDSCTYYLNGQKVYTQSLPKHEELYKIPYVRWHIIGEAGTVGGTLLVDDFMAYPGKDILSIDQVNSPNYPYYKNATAAPDVAMDYPELSDLGNEVIAVMAGTDKAFVNGQLVTMSAAATDRSSGSVFTDAAVPGDFLKQYLGVTGVEDTQMYSLLQYATGKNIVVDSRGLIILTGDVKLDADVDFQVISMLAGYLATGKLVNSYAVLPALDQDMIDKAVHNTELYMVEASARSYDAMATDIALYYLVLASHLDPTMTSSDGISVETEAIRRLKNMLAGGNEPYASASCLWEHSVVTSAILLAKNTPNVWSHLTEMEIKRADLIMECHAIAANWIYNIDNYYLCGFDFRSPAGKQLNPNFLNAYFTSYLNASMYFGAEKLDEIFVNFDHATYVERLTEAGLINILRQWTYTDNLGLSIGYYMENGGEILLKGNTGLDIGDPAGSGVGVKVPFVYEGIRTKKVYDSSQLLEMFIEVLEFTYCWEVMSSNQAPGSIYYSYILSMVQSPWEGQMGMMREFSIGDRSKVRYTWLSAINIAPLYANFKLLGYWDYDANPELAQRMLEMDSRVYVGTEDLYFKMHQGYQGCSQMVQVLEYEEEFVNEGADMIEDIFMNFLFMKNQQIEYTQPEVPAPLLPAAEPMNGVTAPPEGAIPAKGRQAGQQYVTDFYSLFDGKAYNKGKVTFDMVIEDDLAEKGYNVVVAIDKKFPDKTYNESPMMFAFSQEQGISVMDRSGYKPLGIFFGANYRFRAEVEFDCTSRTYSGTITQIWPETDKPIVKSFKDYGFRTSSGMNWSFVDALMPVSATGYHAMWLENVKVEGEGFERPVIDVTEEITVHMDMSGIPSWKRPDQVKVYLGMDEWISPRYVTFSAADGWSDKVFDNLPMEIGQEPVEWNVALKSDIPGYYGRVVKNGENEYTVVWSDTKYFFDSNFETWNKGEYKSADTYIIDHLGNKLRDWFDNAGRSELLRGTEANGNDYLRLGGAKPVQATLPLDENLQAGVYVFKMSLKLEKADTSIVSTHFAYRYGKNIKNTFINVEKNVVRVGGYSLGTLSATEWMDIMVVLDFNTGIGEVFYDDPGYRRTFELDPITGNAITMLASAGAGVLCVDNLSIYTTSGLKLVKPADEANKNAELIIPETPIPELDPAYKWYYNADFEYWNKGAYVKGNTPIKDAYGNTMIDQWNNTNGPLVRGGDESGNHYLELNSNKAMQGLLYVDSEHDDGTYIMKWRMKLKDADSTYSSVAISYRKEGNKKVDFATLDSKGLKVCGKSLGNLSADEWIEVMVVLDFNTLTGTVCDWEGHELGKTTLAPIAGSLFTIFASAGTKGVCIDDLQLYSGDVEILPPLPGTDEPDEPVAPEVVTGIFNSDFETTLATEPNGGFTWLVDADGNKLRVTNGSYSIKEGYLTVSGLESGANSLFYAFADVDAMDLSFKVRLPDAETSVPGGATTGLVLRTHKSETAAVIARIYGQNLYIGGKSYALSTDWTEVTIHVDFAGDEATYTVGAEEGSFAFTGTYDRLELFANNAGAFTLNLDDVHINNCTHEPEAPVEPDPSSLFRSDFEKTMVTEVSGNFTWLVDVDGHKLRVTNGYFTQNNGYLTILGDEEGPMPLMYMVPEADGLDIRFKVRLPDAETTVPSGNGGLVLRTEQNDVNAVLFQIYGQKFYIGGQSYDLSTDWTEVTIHVNFTSDEASFTVGDEKGSFTFAGDLTRLELFAGAAGAFSLHFDDLRIAQCAGHEPEEPGEQETEAPTEPTETPTEPETDPTEPETDPTEPETDPTEPETDPTEPETDPTEPETDPTEPETEPTEPGNWIYNSNFENFGTAAGTSFVDAYGNELKKYGTAMSVVDLGGNKALDLAFAMNETAAINATGGPTLVTIRMQLKLAENASVGANAMEIRYRNASGRPWIIMVSSNAVAVRGGSSVALRSDAWIEVEVVLDSQNGKAYYKFNGEEYHRVADVQATGALDAFNFFTNSAVEGLYMDNFKIEVGGTYMLEPDEPTETPTEPETDPTEPETDPTEPETDPTEPETDPTEPETDTTEPETEPTEPDTTTYFYNNDFESYIFADKNPGWLGKNGVVTDDNGNSIQDMMGYCWVRQEAGNNYLDIGGSGKAVYAQYASETNPISGAVKISFRIRLAENFTLPANTNLHFRTNGQWFTAVMKDSNGADVLACRTGNYPLSDEWLQVTVVMDGATATYTIGDNPSTSAAFAYAVNGFDIRMINSVNFSSGGVHIDDLKISAYEAREEEPETVEAEVAIDWVDGDDHDCIRPDSVFVSVYNGLNLVKREQVTAANNWQHTFTELPRFDAQNNEINYTVVVVSEDLPAGYTAQVTGAAITLTHEPEITWIYKSDFSAKTAPVTGGYDTIADASGHKVSILGSKASYQDEGDNTFLRVAFNAEAGRVLLLSDYSTNDVTTVDVCFKIRLASGMLPGSKVNDSVALRIAKDIVAATAPLSMREATLYSGGQSCELNATEWVDVYVQLNFVTGQGTCRIGEKLGSFTHSLESDRLELYAVTAGTFALDFDDIVVKAQ